MNLPQQQSFQRPARVRLADFTSAVLRLQGGSCTKGELQVVSLTGGLLSLPKPLNHGSRVNLMFMTGTGPVLAMAEMLKPQSWKEQAFRFVELHENDERRLRAVIQPSVMPGGVAPERKPIAQDAFASLQLSPPPENTQTLDREQQWIEKYRAAVSGDPPRKHLLRSFFEHLHRRQSL